MGRPRVSIYHCGRCEAPTNVDGAGTCVANKGGPHEVDLDFHHRHAHSVLDPCPDCWRCAQAAVVTPAEDD